MRQPPPLSQLPKYPVIGGLSLLALGVSLAKFSGKEVSVLYADYHVLQFQLWRLLTPILPHVNVFHLGFNLYWVWVFGSLIEEAFGHLKTLLLVVVLAMGSMGAEFALFSGGQGLSGVGYGFFGMLWVLSRWSPRFRGVVDQNTSILFIAWFFLCIALTYTGTMPVANTAHGVGAILGALIGMSIVNWGDWRRGAAIAGAAALFAASLIGATVDRSYVNIGSDRGQDEAYLGYTAIKAGQPVAALDWYLQAVRMNPENADYWYNLGYIFSQLHDAKRAIESFTRAAKLDPKYTQSSTDVEPSPGAESKPTN